MPLNYTFYHNSSADSYAPASNLSTPRQSRMERGGGGVRILESMTPMSAPAQSRPRQISLTPESHGNVHVKVFDVEGKVLASLTPGMRTSKIRGHADIDGVVVAVNGVSRSCDLAPSLEWLDTTSHIGITASIKNGAPVCSLGDMDAGVSMPDVWGTVPGQRCVYVTDQRGTSGLECN